MRVIDTASPFIEKIIRETKNWKKPLTKSAKIIRDESHENFVKQGFNYGKAWTPLKLATKKQRGKLGFPESRPILIRTGKLKGSVKVVKLTNTSVNIENQSNLAAYHQFGTQKMPARVILSVTDKSVKAIAIILGNHICGLIRGALR